MKTSTDIEISDLTEKIETVNRLLDEGNGNPDKLYNLLCEYETKLDKLLSHELYLEFKV